MSTTDDRNQAADLFLSYIVSRAYDSVIRTEIRELQGESGFPNLPEEERQRVDWYKRLSEEDRRHVAGIIEHAVFGAIFGSLVVLETVPKAC